MKFWIRMYGRLSYSAGRGQRPPPPFVLICNVCNSDLEEKKSPYELWKESRLCTPLFCRLGELTHSCFVVLFYTFLPRKQQQDSTAMLHQLTQQLLSHTWLLSCRSCRRKPLYYEPPLEIFVSDFFMWGSLFSFRKAGLHHIFMTTSALFS